MTGTEPDRGDPGDDQQAATEEHVPPVTLRERHGERREHEAARAEGKAGKPGRQWRMTHAGLQPDGEH